MKNLLISLIAALVCFSGFAQNSPATSGDDIIGTYQGTQEGEPFKTSVTKNNDGTYKAQVIWVKNDKDKDGKKRLDEKNPDKSLRNTPCDKIVLFDHLKYDASRKQWGNTKIYDPTHGIKANVVCHFGKDGSLNVKGSLMGLSQTVVWTKVKQD